MFVRREEEHFGRAEQVVEASVLGPIISKSGIRISITNSRDNKDHSRLWTCFPCNDNCFDVGVILLLVLDKDGGCADKGIDLDD